MTTTPTPVHRPAEPAADTPPDAAAAPAETATDQGGLVEDELLVEDVSIDGMCGVY